MGTLRKKSPAISHLECSCQACLCVKSRLPWRQPILKWLSLSSQHAANTQSSCFQCFIPWRGFCGRKKHILHILDIGPLLLETMTRRNECLHPRRNLYVCLPLCSFLSGYEKTNVRFPQPPRQKYL